MSERELLNRLAHLTGGLLPGLHPPASDLREARRAISAALAGGQVEPITAPANAPDSVPDEEPGQLPDVAAADPTIRVFLRTLPVLTPQSPESVPAWAVGWAVERTLGPFRGPGGRDHWLDVRRLSQQVVLTRGPGGPVVATVPVIGPLLTDATEYQLAAGSVWVSAAALSSAAPAGSFVGLKIDGGVLRVSAAPTPVGAAALEVPAAEVVTVEVRLTAVPTLARPVEAGGAARVGVRLPESVVFELPPGAGRVTVVGDAVATLYGDEITLRPSPAAVALFRADVNCLVVLMAPARPDVRFAGSGSGLFRATGAASIEQAGWAMPVATPVAAPGPPALGPAADAGGLLVAVRGGLEMHWPAAVKSVGGPVRLSKAVLVADAARLTVTATAVARRQTLAVRLWQRKNRAERCTVAVAFPRPVTIQYAASAAPPDEVLLVTGAAITSHIDRPLTADGRPVGVRSADGLIGLVTTADGIRATVLARPVVDPAATAVPLALSNALLGVTPPTMLVVNGHLTDDGMESGYLRLHFGLTQVFPALPDPYATNFRFPDERPDATAAQVLATVEWSSPAAATVGARLLFAARQSAAAALGRAWQVAAVRDDRTAASRGLAAVGTRGEIRFLDVSGRADQFGVSLFPGAGPTTTNTGEGSAVQIRGADLVAPGNRVVLFTPPSFQWEPVWDVPNPNVALFPKVLNSATDGGPTMMAVETGRLVPLAPLPTAAEFVRAYNDADAPAVARARFTLPFGMEALARLDPAPPRQPGGFLVFAAGLAEVRPAFPASGATGGLQLTLTPPSSFPVRRGRSPSFDGWTAQQRNGTDRTGSVPGDFSALGPQVDTIFNAEFNEAPAGNRPRVPVTRIDLSGYGASCISDWRNPSAATAETAQVRFEAFRGRTAYEVVQVVSFLYPWGGRVVRTVTMQRTGGGGVFRRDSGWQSAGDARYAVPGISTHPGVVPGLVDLRAIRDTNQVYERTYPPGHPHNNNPNLGQPLTVRLAMVRFDADVEIERATVGRNAAGRVPGRDLVGYVQLAPSGPGRQLTPGQLDDLLAERGPAGGVVDAEIDVGGSTLAMRVTAVSAARTVSTGGSPEVAVAALGTPLLPRAGQWTVVRRTPADPELRSIDPSAAVPLVRRNPIGPTAQPLRFAEPADLFQDDTPVVEYGLLQSTDAQRLLLQLPKVDPGDAAVTSRRPLLFADTYALAGGVSAFPPPDGCLPLPAGSRLLTTGRGRGRLEIPAQPGLPADTFAVSRPDRVLTRPGSLTVRAVYGDHRGNPCRVTLRADSDAVPNWSAAVGPVRLAGTMGPFDDLLQVVGAFESAADQATRLSGPRLVFGGALGPVQSIINFLEDIGLSIPLGVSLTNTEYKIQSGGKLSIPPYTGPGGADKIDIGIGKFKGELQVGFGNSADTHEPDEKLFAAMEHWRLYFSLYGNVQVAVLPPIPVYVGGILKFEITGKAGKPAEIGIKFGVALSVGGELLGPIIEAEGEVNYGYVLKFEGPKIGIGVFLGFKIGAEILGGLVGIEFAAEAMALIGRLSDDKGFVAATFSVGIEVTLGWVFSETFEAEFEYKKEIGMPKFLGELL